jgi:serine/threonine protein kinase
MQSKDPPAAGGLQIGQLLDGRYRIEALIGAGGMGKVYRATREQLGKRVAIKTLETDIKVSERAELIERFAREAQATAAIRHENVVEIIDFGQTSECVYFVMELLEGYVLADLIGHGRTLEPARMVPLAVQIANALHAAHVQGTIHRDVKPSNVFISPNREGQERVKVLDFGLAKVADGLKLTRAGVMFGTGSYMSPEQARGASLDARTDVYALGCVLFESLAGRPPFVGDSLMAIIGQHLQKPPPRLAELRPGLQVPAGLEELIECTLAKKAEQRFSGMEAMVRALMSLELPPPSRVEVARPMSPTPASAQRRVEPKWGEPKVIELLAALYIMQSYSTDDELAAQEAELITELLHVLEPEARLAKIERIVAQARTDHERAGSDQLRRAQWEQTCEQLRDRLNEDQRRQVFANMWRIAGADGRILDAERQFIAATIERFNAPAISTPDAPDYEPTTFVRPVFESAADAPDHESTSFVRPVFETDALDHEPTSLVIPVFRDEPPQVELAATEPRTLIAASSSEPPLVLLSEGSRLFAPPEISAAPPMLTSEAPESPPIAEFGFSSELIRERFEQCRVALAELLDGTQPLAQLADGALVRWREHAKQLGLERVGARRELTVCFEDATRPPDERLTAALLLLTIAGKDGAALLLERAALGDRESLDVTITALELGGNGQHLLRGCADAAPEQRGAWLRALERQAIDPGPAVLEHALASEQPDELAAGLALLCMHEAREQHASSVIPHLFAQEADVRSAAIVAGLVLGLPQAPILLAQTARRPGMVVAALLHAIEAKPKQLDTLIEATPLSEDLAFALALCGRPRAIAAVIDFVCSSASPRLLAGLRWTTGFAGTLAQLPSWWAEHRAAFESAARLLLGQPISARRLCAALPRVTTAVWPALRLELLVRSKGALRLRAHGLPDALLAAASRLDEAQLRWLDR